MTVPTRPLADVTHRAIRLGEEAYDPSLFYNFDDPLCPSGRSCRYSDVAIFRYNSSVSVGFAKIAKTIPGPGPGMLDIIGEYTITAEMHGGYFFENATLLAKVGRTTGTTENVVIKTCVRTNVFNSGVDLVRTLLCQTQSDYTSDGGDSGSPVYGRSTATNPDRNVLLYGIHWGTARSVEEPFAPVYRTFSAMNMIAKDFYRTYDLVFASCPQMLPYGDCYNY